MNTHRLALAVRLTLSLLAALLAALALPAPAQAATISWDGGGGDNLFSNPLNWSGDVLPAPSDDIVLPDGATYSVVVDTNRTVRSLTVAASPGNGTQTLVIPAGQTLVAGLGGAVGASGVVELNGGALVGGSSAGLTNAGVLISTGAATNTLSLQVTNQADATIELNGSADLNIVANGFISNFGGVIFRADNDLNLLSINSTPLTTQAGGSVSKQGGAGTASVNGSNGVLINFGLLEAETGQLTLNIPVSLDGATLNTSPGATLSLANDVTLANLISGNSAGTLELLAGAQAAASGPVTVGVGGNGLVVRGGATLQLDPVEPLSVAGVLELNPARGAPVTVQGGGLVVQSGGALKWTGGGTVHLDGYSIISPGGRVAAEWNSLDDDATWSGVAGVTTWTNQGVFEKSGAGTVVVDASVQFDNDGGTLAVTGGALHINGSPLLGNTNLDVSAGSELVMGSAGGMVMVTSVISGNADGVLRFGDGTGLLGQAGTSLNVSGHGLELRGSTVNGNGASIAIAVGGRVTLAAGSDGVGTTLEAGGITVNDAGTLVVASSVVLGNGAHLDVANGGTLAVVTDGSLAMDGDALTSTLGLAGALVKSGAGTASVNVPVEALGGSIAVDGGTLSLTRDARLENAAVAVQGGASLIIGGVGQTATLVGALTGAALGEAAFEAGTTIMAGSPVVDVAVSGNGVTLTDNTLTGGGGETIEFLKARLQNILVTSITISNVGEMEVHENIDLNFAHLINYGQLTTAPGDGDQVSISGAGSGASFRNAPGGVMSIVGLDEMYINGDDLEVVNEGNVEVQDGLLHFQGDSTQTGAFFSAGVGGIIRIGGPDATAILSGGLSGAVAGQVAIEPGTTVVAASPVVDLSFSGQGLTVVDAALVGNFNNVGALTLVADSAGITFDGAELINAASASMDWGGIVYRLNDGARVVNQGTWRVGDPVDFVPADIRLEDGARIENQGTWFLNVDVTTRGAGTGPNSLVNAGSLDHSEAAAIVLVLDNVLFVNEPTGVYDWRGGEIGLHNFADLQNHGTWYLGGSGSLTASGTGPNTVVNFGDIETSGGGDYTVNVEVGVDFHTQGGRISAADGSAAFTGDFRVTDARLEVSGPWTLRLGGPGARLGLNGTVSGGGDGSVIVTGGSEVELGIAGVTVNLVGTGLEVAGAQISGGDLTNTGVLKLTTGTAGPDNVLAAITLHNAAGGVLDWTSGNVILQNSSHIVNDGQLVIAAERLLSGAGTGPNTVTNSGAIEKTGGTGTTTFAVALDNDGGLTDVLIGGLQFAADARFRNGAILTVHPGAIADMDGNVTVIFENFAGIRGSGAINVDHLVGGAPGWIDAFIRPGFSPGVLTWIGPYSPSPTLALDIEVGGLTPGGEHDQLAVEGAATLDGSLNLSLLNGFVPADGDSFVILTATGGVSGSFANDSFDLGDGRRLQAVYNANDVTLVVVDQTVDVHLPVITVDFPAPDGLNGWHVSGPVVGSVTADDTTTGGSDITAISCVGAQVGPLTRQGTPKAGASLIVDADGQHAVTCTATDSAGNDGAAPGSTNTATVMLDTVAPAIQINTPADGAAYALNQAVAVDYTCADATSGGDVCAGPVASGAALDTSSLGVHDFMVNASDTAGNGAQLAHTYTVGGANAIVNGDFEAGPGVGWTEFSLRRQALITTDLPHAGSYGAHLCGHNRCLDLIQQAITIPAGGQLTYWWYMTSQDSHHQLRDLLTVAFYRPNGRLVALLRVHTNAGSRDTWQKATIDLTPWEGQDVTLIFLATGNASNPTHFYLDDIRVSD